MGLNGTDPELKIKVTADGSQARQEIKGVESAAADLKKATSSVTDEQRSAAQEAVRNLTRENGASDPRRILGLDKIKGAAEEAKLNIGELRQTARESTEAIRGLGEASEGSLFGAASAARGLSGALKGIGIALSGPFIATIGAVAGAGAAMLALIVKRAEDTRAEIEKIYKEHEQRSENIKRSIEETQAEEKHAFEVWLKDIEKTISAYDELLGRMSSAQKRFEQSTKLQADLGRARLDRDEQEALSKATTDQDREKIKTDFATRRNAFEDRQENDQLLNTKLEGQLQIRNAEDQQNSLQGELDRAQREASERKENAERAKDFAKQSQEKYGVDAPLTKRAQAEAEVALAGAKAATENLKLITERVAEGMKKIEEQVADGQAKIEQATVGAEIRSTKVKTDALKTGNEERQGIAAAENEARDAAARGDNAAQDKAANNARKLVAIVKQANDRANENATELEKVFTEHSTIQRKRDEVIIKNIRHASNQTEQVTRQLINNRE